MNFYRKREEAGHVVALSIRFVLNLHWVSNITISAAMKDSNQEEDLNTKQW